MQFSLRPDRFSFVLTTEKLVGDLPKAFGSFATEKTEKKKYITREFNDVRFLRF